MKSFFLILVVLLIFTFKAKPQMNNDSKISGNSFSTFLEKVYAEQDEKRKQVVADEFVDNLREVGYPIFENDTTVILLYKGEKDTVEIIGDMTNWVSTLPMEKIPGTDLYYYRGTYESTARLEYWIQFSKLEFPIVDPFNKYKSANGFGDISELAMPGYVRHTIFNNYMYGKRGDYSSLTEVTLLAGILPYEHTVHIYLPPNYKKDERYPVVYFQDGKDYIEFAVAPHILTEMIKNNKMKPVIAVFVTPPNLHQPKVPNRMTEYGLNDDYVEFFTNELVNYIDSNYSASQKPEDRLVVGDSYGGLISTYIAYSRPDIFGLAYSQSGYHSFNKDKMISLISTSDKKPISLYVDTGTYERNVGASFLPADETDFLSGNRRLKAALESKDYDFVYKEYYEGHTWGNWRRHLVDAFTHFFGK